MTLFSGLSFTDIGDPIIFGSFYYLRTAAIFILFVFAFYLFYLLYWIYRRSSASGRSIEEIENATIQEIIYI